MSSWDEEIKPTIEAWDVRRVTANPCLRRQEKGEMEAHVLTAYGLAQGHPPHAELQGPSVRTEPWAHVQCVHGISPGFARH